MPFARAELPGMGPQSSGCSCSVDTGLWVNLYNEIYDDVAEKMKQTGLFFNEEHVKHEASKRFMLHVYLPDIKSVVKEWRGDKVMDGTVYDVTNHGLEIVWKGERITAEYEFVLKRRSMGLEDPDETRTFYRAQKKILASPNADVWFPVHEKADGEDRIRYAAHWVRDGNRVRAETHRIAGDRDLSLKEARQVIREKVGSYAPHETSKTDASFVFSNIQEADHRRKTLQAQYDHNIKQQKDIISPQDIDIKMVHVEKIYNPNRQVDAYPAEHRVIRDAADTLLHSSQRITKDTTTASVAFASFLRESFRKKKRIDARSTIKNIESRRQQKAKEKFISQKILSFFRQSQPERPEGKIRHKVAHWMRRLENNVDTQHVVHAVANMSAGIRKRIVLLSDIVSKFFPWTRGATGTLEGGAAKRRTQSIKEKQGEREREFKKAGWFIKLFKRENDKQAVEEHWNIICKVQPLKAEKISPFYTMLRALAAKLQIFPVASKREGIEITTQQVKEKQELMSEEMLPEDNHLVREKSIDMFETTSDFFVSALLWYVLYEADVVNFDAQNPSLVDEKNINVSIHQYKTEKLVQSTAGGNWILFSIIWYLAMIREQGKRQGVKQKKKGGSKKKTIIWDRNTTNPPAILPQHNIIFVFRS
ncbi:hypothetical protein KJ618_03400 [Patescibacteria group bacterium]|nr:hypothetical protein [Patescibacteria group bacterium]